MALSKVNILSLSIAISLILKLILLYILGFQDFPDSITYKRIAREIYELNFLFPHWENSDAPGAPYFFSFFVPLSEIIGDKAFAIGNVIISSISILIFYKISFLIFNDLRIANMTAIISAFYPFFNFYSISGLNETLYIFLLYLSFIFFIKFYKKLETKDFILFSIFFAITTLIKFVNLAMIPFIVVFTIFFMRRKDCSLKKITSIIFLGVFSYGLIMSPWWLRNYDIHNEVVLTNIGQIGKVFYAGNNALNKTGGGINGIDISLEDLDRFRDQNLSDGAMINEALNWIKNNPTDWIILEFKKIIRFYSPFFHSERYNTFFYNTLSVLTYGTILLFSIISIFRNSNLALSFGIMLLYSILLTGIHLVFIVSMRYRLPIEPFMIIMASEPLTRIFNRYKSKDS